MSTGKIPEMLHNMDAVGTNAERDTKLLKWVGRELNNLRISYCAAHNMTMDQFAQRVGITKKHLYALFRAESSPGIDTLNQILVSCNSNLLDFFQRLAKYETFLAIQKTHQKDYGTVELLITGLSNPKTRPVVEGAASAVAAFLDLEAAQ